jgi:asparagine synthase (glutamine-hydrolysing)
MCGIAGWLGAVVDGELAASRMLQALRHRGPDAQGIRSWPEATLAHTRLSIIDLSPAGGQPMGNEDGTIWTVFNGEIYNHRELRHDLEVRGHIFQGRSDTEILPHLYEEEGVDFVSKLRGMFALAIYDRRAQKLLLVRDRFGVKPLFYSAAKDHLAFASEINALREFPGVDTRPDRQAIYDFVALSYIPAPETFYTGIRALQPGEMLEARFDNNKISCDTRIFHRWSIAPDPSITLQQAADRAEELVSRAVQRQLESDVPLGALLSGGIDSSLVSVAAQEALGGTLKTFNVQFPDTKYDETWAAIAVAEHIASQHKSLPMNGQTGTWEHITRLLWHAGQPFADTSVFAVNAVCRLMREHVTVALSGDGGDEAFGGYDFYWQMAKIARLQTLPPFIWRGASFTLSPVASLGSFPASLPERVMELAEADDIGVIQNLFCWTRERERDTLSCDRNCLPIRRLFEPQWEHYPVRGASRIEKLSMLAAEVNVRLTLPNDYLFKVDIASMKESLEVRVPMLDEELFAFGLSLPHHLKVNGRTCKRVLREVAKRRVPVLVANKPKWGFGIPVDTWVDANFRARVKEALLGRSSRLPDFFRPTAYRPVVEAFCERRPCSGVSREGLYQRVIMFLSIQTALAC